ncbi:MAG: flippase-like domain-containing protein [Proteobacteria bacterium]|nr:flippase-like domain-containing protein [Pseudomonadota bacterium]
MSVTPTLPRPPAGPASGRATRRPLRRDRLVLAGLLLLFALGVVGIARATDWHDIARLFARLSLGQVAALLALSALNYALRGLRWHILVQSLGLHPRLLANVLHFVGGFAMSVTPGRVGELVRLRWLARDSGVGLDRAAPVVVGDRASDLAALALLLAGALGLATLSISGAVPLTLLALAAALAVTHPRLTAAAVALGHRLTGRRAPRLFARLRRMSRSLDRFARPAVLVPALLCGLIGWSAEAWAFHLLLGWFGAPTGFATALAIFVFATLAGGLTGAPGGLGGAEAAMIALLALDGTPLGIAIAATALIRATTLWFAVGLGIIAFPFAERAGATRTG